MAAPSNVGEFLALIEQSGVQDKQPLDRYVHQLKSRASLPDNPCQLARDMINDNFLTPYQADQLLLGKWRGFSIGRYRVLDQIGEGGMGTVYLCEHKHMRRRVAIKVLPMAKAANPGCLERFYREARAVAALDHPHVVRAYDIAQDRNLHFLAMEYVEGLTLQEMVKQRGPLTPLQAAYYMHQVALGLQHVYEAKLVHRDIKPGNILVDHTGNAKILDLGLARFFLDETDELSRKHEETILGTVDYVSPEGATDSHTVDIRGDIYSLGCTIYFCLTGQPPFKEGTMAQKMIFHMTRQIKPIRELREDVPKEFARILEKALTKDPRGRYQTPKELAQALGALSMLGGETAGGTSEKTLTQWKAKSKKSKKKKWRLTKRWRIAMGVLLGIVGTVALFSLVLLAGNGNKDKKAGTLKTTALQIAKR